MRYVLKGFCVLAAVVLSRDVFAQPGEGQIAPKGVVAGSVEYAQVDAPQRNTQLMNLEQVLEWGRAVQKIARESGKGSPPVLEDGAVSYLSVLYLYCTSNKGICPFILDTILEGDIESSRELEKPACPTMKRFWKMWLSSGMEERAKFDSSITRGLEVAEFNSQVRPRYIRCGEAVQDALKDPVSLAARYGPEGSSTKTIAEFLKFLEEVREQKTDILRSTGIIDDSDSKPPAKK
jgi:hypothetical protein